MSFLFHWGFFYGRQKHRGRTIRNMMCKCVGGGGEEEGGKEGGGKNHARSSD